MTGIAGGVGGAGTAGVPPRPPLEGGTIIVSRMLVFFKGAPVFALTTWPSIDPLGGACGCACPNAATLGASISHKLFMVGFLLRIMTYAIGRGSSRVG
jgi:hypothetical protein